MSFKPGDLVICVKKPKMGDAEVGKSYRVLSVDYEGVYVWERR